MLHARAVWHPASKISCRVSDLSVYWMNTPAFFFCFGSWQVEVVDSVDTTDLAQSAHEEHERGHLSPLIVEPPACFRDRS